MTVGRDAELRVDSYLEALPPDDRPELRRRLLDHALIADPPQVDEDEERARALLLAKFMSINSRCWLAVWKFDIEFDLWEMVESEQPGPYGLAEVSESDLSSLLELAEAGNAWFRDVCSEGDEETRVEIVPLGEWRIRWREIASEARKRR